MKFKVRSAAIAPLGLLAAIVWGQASAVEPFVLPTPANNPNASFAVVQDPLGTPRQAIIMDGIPIAFMYDDFWSYSAKILDSIQTESPSLIPIAEFGTYDFSTGTGTIDINLTSVAGGATNQVDGLSFQDPADLASNQQIEGWQCDWGGSTQTCDFQGQDSQDYSVLAADVGGVTTVGNLLAYLQTIDPSFTIPVIYADYNQTGAGDSLWLSAMVEIIDPSDDSTVAMWALDALNNNTWDPDAPTYNFGDITFEGSAADCAAAGPWNPLTGVGCAGVTDSGETYSGSHNLGSGLPDFLAFAPEMDLSLFNPDHLWKITAMVGCFDPFTQPLDGENAGCNSNGGEEFGIAGGVGPQQVPEPKTITLLGIGLVVVAGLVRRRKKALSVD